MTQIKTTMIATAVAVIAHFSFNGSVEASPIKEAIVPESMQSTYEEFKYAPAIRAGNMLYLSGVVARLEESDNGNTAPAIERAFDQIEAILTEANASWANVVDVTSYMTDLDRDIGQMWAIKEQRVPAPHPAWTVIGVSKLFGGEAAIIEIKVTAYIPD